MCVTRTAEVHRELSPVDLTGKIKKIIRQTESTKLPESAHRFQDQQQIQKYPSNRCQHKSHQIMQTEMVI